MFGVESVGLGEIGIFFNNATRLDACEDNRNNFKSNARFKHFGNRHGGT